MSKLIFIFKMDYYSRAFTFWERAVVETNVSFYNSRNLCKLILLISKSIFLDEAKFYIKILDIYLSYIFIYKLSLSLFDKSQINVFLLENTLLISF